MTTPTRELLDHIVQQMAAGEEPVLTPELSEFFDTHPEAVFDTLDLYARALGAGDAKDDERSDALGELLTIQLEHLRYRLDRGYQSARDLQDRFERRIIELVQDGTLPGSDLSLVVASMTEAGLEPGAELEALDEAEILREIGDKPDIGLVEDMMRSLAEEAEGDSFAIADVLIKGSRTAPAQARGLLAETMLRHPHAALREAAALFALDRDAEVRRVCALAFLANVDGITPVALRRLIVTRHWLPEAERHLVDQVARAARAKGIEIAPAPAVGKIDLRCSGIDGSGAQGFIMLVPNRDEYSMISVLMRYQTGVLDAWCGETGTKRELLAGLESAHEQFGMSMLRPAKRDYLDRVVTHHLAVGLAQGKPPPVGLLQVAETVGTTEWRPQRLDWREIVEALLSEAPASLREPERVAETMQSIGWANPDGLLDGWFEDDPAAAEIVGGMSADIGERESLDVILRQLLEPRREKWAAHFAWVALWLHERTPNRDPAWVRFALLARELDRRQRLAALPLMCVIGFNTIEAMRDRVEEEDELKLL
jgi:hypothetical protein